MADDERHLFGGAQRGRDNQIALALAILVIGDDDEFAVGKGLQNFLDRIGHLFKVSLFCRESLAGLAAPRQHHYAGQSGSRGTTTGWPARSFQVDFQSDHEQLKVTPSPEMMLIDSCDLTHPMPNGPMRNPAIR